MSIFKKKYDIEKDLLRKQLDLDNGKYVFYLGNDIIGYDELNRKSKKILDKLNKELIDDPSILRRHRIFAKRNERIDRFIKKGIDISNSFEFLGIPQGTMSKEVAEYLNNITSDERLLVGIHRTSFNGSNVADVLQNGLVLTGHKFVANNDPKIEQNVSFYPNNKTIIKEALGAYAYKESTGSFIIVIPENEISNDLYYIDKSGNKRLKPKYVGAYLQYGSKHNLDTIILNKYANSFDNNIKNELPEQHQYTISDLVNTNDFLPFSNGRTR